MMSELGDLYEKREELEEFCARVLGDEPFPDFADLFETGGTDD